MPWLEIKTIDDRVHICDTIPTKHLLCGVCKQGVTPEQVEQVIGHFLTMPPANTAIGRRAAIRSQLIGYGLLEPDVSDRLRYARMQSKKTAADLAKEIGVMPQTISELESGRISPANIFENAENTRAMLCEIAYTLGIKPDYLLGE